MLDRNAKERISHILLAIQEIQDFTQGMDFDAFNADDKTIRAVEMNFIIIGNLLRKFQTKLKINIRIFPGI